MRRDKIARERGTVLERKIGKEIKQYGWREGVKNGRVKEMGGVRIKRIIF